MHLPVAESLYATEHEADSLHEANAWYMYTRTVSLHKEMALVMIV